MKKIQEITKYSLVLVVLLASFVIPVVSQAQARPTVTSLSRTQGNVGDTVYFYGNNLYITSGTLAVGFTNQQTGITVSSQVVNGGFFVVPNIPAGTYEAEFAYLDSSYPTSYITNIDGTWGASNGLVFTVGNSQTYMGLQVSCRPNTNSAQINTQVGWSASGVGGNGYYTYSWTGTDGLIGNSNSILNTYTSIGNKTTSITVTSGDGQTATANCGSINVYSPQTNYYPNYYGTLSGSCSANVSSSQIGNTINWSGYASGGNGVYTYYWNDSDGYSSTGQYLSRYYTSAGNKNMNLTITSNGQSIIRTCSVYVAPSTIINTTYPTYYPTQNQVLAYTDTNPSLDSVYLSDVPATGLEDIVKPTLFALVLILWSAMLAYMFLKKKIGAEVLVPAKISHEKSADLVASNEKAGALAASNEKYIKQIEDYARTYKVLLSSEASVSLLKLSKLEKINISEAIKKMAGEDWTAIGEKDLEKYL